MKGKCGRWMLVALIVLAFTLTACSVDGSVTTGATPDDFAKYDKAREGTLRQVESAWATRDAKKEAGR